MMTRVVEVKRSLLTVLISWILGLQEWDGMIKIVFNRKNKMLHSCFTTKTVLALLEQNYKTYCSLNNEVG